ncbi:hypothetical protein P8610_09340 [Fictibacillus sp. UD]
MIGALGLRLLRDRRAGETLKSETSKCGSPPAPRKAKHLERKSTHFLSYISPQKKGHEAQLRVKVLPL